MTVIPASSLPKRNGNEKIDQLPEHRQKTVEAGLAMHQKVLAERDELEAKLRDATMKIEGLTVQLDALKGVVNMMESTYMSTKLEMETRVSTHMAQRDEAVTRTAMHEATLANLYVILRNAIAGSEAATGHVDEAS
jgi:phosphoribosylaminoimidazole-succinocarboxamide synthase